MAEIRVIPGRDPAEKQATRDRAQRRGPGGIVRRARYVCPIGDDGAEFRRSGPVAIVIVRWDMDSKARADLRGWARRCAVILTGLGEPIIADDPRAKPQFDSYRAVGATAAGLREFLWHSAISRWEFDVPRRYGAIAAGSSDGAATDRARAIRVRPDMRDESPATRLGTDGDNPADVTDPFPTAGRVVGVPGLGRVRPKRRNGGSSVIGLDHADRVDPRCHDLGAFPAAHPRPDAPQFPCPYLPVRD